MVAALIILYGVGLLKEAFIQANEMPTTALPKSLQSPHADLAQVIIQKHSALIGKELSVKKARLVSNLVIDSEGNVGNLGVRPIDIQRLLEHYSDLLGSSAVAFAIDAAQPIIKQYPDIDLPDIMKSKA